MTWEPPEDNYPYMKWPIRSNHIIALPDHGTKDEREKQGKEIALKNMVLDMLEDFIEGRNTNDQEEPN